MLVVAGVLIMNVTLIGVSQRPREIGLLKALGASSQDILNVFVAESVLMALVGTAIGLLFGIGLVSLLAATFVEVPFAVPYWAVAVAFATRLRLQKGSSGPLACSIHVT